MDWLSTVSLALGSAWTSGINLYATVFILGLFQKIGLAKLPGGLEVLDNWWVVGIAAFLYSIEFIADKVPYVDSVWDVVHTFIRVPAGAVLAYSATANFDPSAQAIAFLLGGGVAFSSHGTKTTARALANLSPEPVSNWILSLVEDAIAITGVIIAIFAPLVIGVIVILFLFIFFRMLPKILRTLRRMFSAVNALFNGRESYASAIRKSSSAISREKLSQNQIAFMKKYFLIISLLASSFTSCSSIQDNQTKANQSLTLSNRVNNQINNNSSADSVAEVNAKQKFNPAKVVHLTTSETHLKRGGSAEAILTLKIDDPFHVNSNPPSEKNFIPLEVNFESAEDIKVGKPVYPKGKAKTFAFSDKPLSIYSDEVVIKLPLKTNRTADQGQQTLNGQLRFQACDEEVCYPPQNVNVQLPVTID